MNKKYIFFIPLLIVVIMVLLNKFLPFRSSYSSLLPTAHKNEEIIKSTSESIAESFSIKYERPIDSFIIETSKDVGTFAQGSVRFKDEKSGAIWFAAQVNGQWQLVYDGNGIINCNDLKNYPQFPTSLIPQCFDENSSELIKR